MPSEPTSAFGLVLFLTGAPAATLVAAGLKANDTSDAVKGPDSDGCTNVEEFLNSLQP